MIAIPAKYFAHPPYRAELFCAVSGWSGVMNKNGINCLTFTDMPGAVISDFETCREIAAEWNDKLDKRG